MGGGDDEDPKRELERLDRDLAAIDARWATEGYQQRTQSKVLDDERTTRRQLARRIAEIRGLPPPLTPAAGTVALNVGSAWRPLAVDAAEKPVEPLPAFDVTDEEEQPRPLEELERELHGLLSASPYRSNAEIDRLISRFRKTPGASRLLAAALRSSGRSELAAQMSPPPIPMRSYLARVVNHPLLTEATELPDETTGLTATQTTLMRVLRQVAPETGPFMRASEVFAEVRVAAPDLDEARFTSEVAMLGHPSLRRLPLVAFQGFSGRVSPTPTFTHVRLTTIGREVIDGTFPIPNLAVNGAAGSGACLLPMAPGELAEACLEVFVQGHAALRKYAFDMPEGTRTSSFGFHNATYGGGAVKVGALPIYSFEMNASGYGCRIIVDALAWPCTVADLLPELQNLLSRGLLDGVTGYIDESSADRARLVIELEHVAFRVPIEQKLRNSGLFDVEYSVEMRVRSWPGPYDLPSLSEFLRAFLESRKEAAVKRLDARVLKFVVEAQRMEAVCLALLMIERVQSVLRETLDDSEGEAALMKCMRPEDRALLAALPFRASHDYATGFTQDQARHLVKKRKLAATPSDSARTDWMRALDALENARQTLSARDNVMELVREELKRAVERFGSEPRRSKSFG